MFGSKKSKSHESPANEPGARKYKVPYGTANRVAKELTLSHVHVGKVIKGERKAGPTLAEALEREERLAAGALS